MTLHKIQVPFDPRVSHRTTHLNGRQYHYLLGEPAVPQIGTLFLIHGWPDLSIGWRYQIPLLLESGYRVVAPDIMGFGRSDAPKVPPESISSYSFKQAAFDIKELADQLNTPTIILGGHDWGGAIVYRVCLWFPDLVTHVFSVCTPYSPPYHGDFVPLADRVRTVLPNFAYQLQLGSGEVQKIVRTRESIRQFLAGIYGGRGPKGEIVFSPKDGILFENLPKIGHSPLLSPEELEYYVEEYMRNGMDGNLNWYKNQKQNHDDELELNNSIIGIPTLFISATNDTALPPWMSANMEKSIPNMTRREVEASHWALWEKPDEVNGYIKDWLEIHHFRPDKGRL